MVVAHCCALAGPPRRSLGSAVSLLMALFFLTFVPVLHLRFVLPRLAEPQSPRWWANAIAYGSIHLTLTVHYLLARFTDPGFVTGLPIDKRSAKSTDDCVKCRHRRPPRTHHCSVCGRCIARMDHHCALLGRCVGLGNRCHFLRLLWFLMGSSGLTLGSILYGDSLLLSVPPFDDEWVIWVLRIFLFLTFTFAAAFGVFHTHLLLINCTTLEFIDKHHPAHTHDRGWRRNVAEVFGDGPILLRLFLPLPAPGIPSPYSVCETDCTLPTPHQPV